jgi:hypothetical protein
LIDSFAMVKFEITKRHLFSPKDTRFKPRLYRPVVENALVLVQPFYSNRTRMRYREYLATGPVEGACKT